MVEEILSAGPVEVGIAPTHRCTLELARTVRRPASQLINLGTKDVILVTGGARGCDRRGRRCPGRDIFPHSDSHWPHAVAGIGAGVGWPASPARPNSRRPSPSGSGREAGPRQVGEHYQKLLAQREIRRTLERIAATGAKAAYFPVNITDAKAVADMLQQVRVKFGPVTALVHGAGVLADKRIEDLTRAQFDSVYATKVDGLRNLLDLLTHENLKALVLFSSTTARFGRLGQAAYACANEVLNKIAQVEARRRLGCRVVAINWGPWDGGMVTPGLRKVFESEGIGLIPLHRGCAVPHSRTECRGQGGGGRFPGQAPRLRGDSNPGGPAWQHAATTERLPTAGRLWCRGQPACPRAGWH